MKKTVVITGANRGLGKAFVDVLIKDQDCFIVSLSRSLSEEQKSYSSKQFYFLELDLSKNNVESRITVLKDLIGDEPVYFINNANIIEPVVTIEHLDTEAIDKAISVNIKSTMVITNYFLRNFKTNLLTFVNISSGAANRAICNWSLYCSSKAFIEMFFKVAQCEYPPHSFFNINPGVMDTGMQKSLRDSHFPDVENFKDLHKEGQLKAPIDVAAEILKTVQLGT
ncbi:SDR family NAD(P)-dependent oxidoreductase [Paucihalobacter sp.]|uniref:SDR family NAD(P)-dependent oxidoreductase n=1 Tax=Paucihalobacter sp. TaxID=2850405 RepID=UPI002FDF894D